MAPVLALVGKILLAMVVNKDFIAALILKTQELAGDTPGEMRFKAVADAIRELLDDTDADDKVWEKAWAIARPLFNLFVAKVKGKIPATPAA